MTALKIPLASLDISVLYTVRTWVKPVPLFIYVTIGHPRHHLIIAVFRSPA